MPGGRPRKNGATDARQSDTAAANVGYEARLWQMADALRGSMDAAEYKHVVLGLIFLKYVSDAFEEQHDGRVSLRKASSNASAGSAGLSRASASRSRCDSTGWP
jgi:type I restriction-modification system DNA methylase subunit